MFRDCLRFFDHASNVTGSRRFHAKVGAVMIVQAAVATLLASAPRRNGTLRQTSLGPVARALKQKPDAA